MTVLVPDGSRELAARVFEMATLTRMVNTYPVVYYDEASRAPGWYFRDAGETALHGPFASRTQAVDFALKTAVKCGAKGTPEPGREAA